jgi:putative peptidoglycan lipid II flippase
MTRSAAPSASVTLARAGMIVSSAFLVSRILGWVRLVVIGNTVGATADLDAFYAAFRIPDLIFQLVAAGALSSALIPIVSGLLATDGSARAWRVVSTVMNLMLIGLAILSTLMFILAPTIVPIITPGFDAATLATTIELTRIMLASAVLLAVGAVATSVLNASGRFAAAAVAPSVYNLAIIGGTLLLYPSIGITGVAVGVVAGALGHVLVQLPPLGQVGFRYTPHIDARDSAARKALGLMVPRAIGLGASQITFVVVTSIATTLGVGAVTAFTVAFSLLQIPIGIIGVPLGIVLMPSLSREMATGRETEYIALLTRALRVIVFVMVPIAALAAILRTEAVTLLFGYGFSVDAIALTAATLFAFLAGLVAHSLIAVLARAFYARQDTLTPVLVAITAVIVNTTLAFILVGPLGLPGVALAIAIAAWLEAGLLAVLLHRRIAGLHYGVIGRTAVLTALATIIASVVGIPLRNTIIDATAAWPTIVGLLAVIAVVGVVYSAIFLVAARALRIAELPAIVGLMVDALPRRRRS